MVEFQDGDRPVDVDGDVFELHVVSSRGPRLLRGERLDVDRHI
jgi:hypothetical protein